MPEKIYSKPPTGKKEGDDQKAGEGVVIPPVDEESIEDVEEDKDDDDAESD